MILSASNLDFKVAILFNVE